jgi:two-component system cell cycle response regulator PopA
MDWTTTLAICHAAGEEPRELRAALLQDGRRCLLWSPGADAAGLAQADVVVFMPALAAQAGPEISRAPYPSALVLALTTGAAAWADAALHPETALKLVAERVNALIRLVILELECDLRRTTLASGAGLKLDERGPKAPARIRALYIGGPNKEFGSLQDALALAEIELRPVLRAGLALDEIENGLVDAVVLDAAISPQETRELSLLLRRNSDLALAPVLVLDPQGTHAGRAPSLLSDVIRGTPEPLLVAARIGQLVRESRRRRRALTFLRRIRMKEVFDAQTGLSMQSFLDTHLRTHLEASQRSGRALVAGVFRVEPREALKPAEAQSMAEQIASLTARLIRAEDTAARISDDAIAVLFPATSESAAQAALKRIAAVLGATHFHANRFIEGVSVDVDWTVFSPKPGDSISATWTNAAAELAAGTR